METEKLLVAQDFSNQVTSLSLNVMNIPKQNENSFIIIPTWIYPNGSYTPKTVKALLDSGSQGNFIDAKITKQLNLPEKILKQPIPLRFADGTINEQSTVKTYAQVELMIDGKIHAQPLYVTNLTH